MNYAKAALWVVERLFDLAEIISSASERSEAKKRGQQGPSPLSLRDLMEMKQQDSELYRRTHAPTVVIPPPSERFEKRR